MDRIESKSFILILEYIDGCRRFGGITNEDLITKAFKLFDIDGDEAIDEQEHYWAMVYLAQVEE